MEHQPAATNTSDERRSPRRALEAPIRMRVISGELQGVSDNLSAVGIMFFAEEPLLVAVEVEEDGEIREYTGRLVRAQKMSEHSTGFAIEFDPK